MLADLNDLVALVDQFGRQHDNAPALPLLLLFPCPVDSGLYGEAALAITLPP
nr:hypothetical protein [uncultured Rhodopila sp.]